MKLELKFETLGAEQSGTKIKGGRGEERETYGHVFQVKFWIPALTGVYYESKMAKLQSIYIVLDTSPLRQFGFLTGG